jgi:5-(carboxyamino)imidazole ribonucleotide mutase
MLAAKTRLPVLGVPVQSRALKGLDSLLSIAQMPAGVPVGTLALGESGAKNAGLLAAAIVALHDDKVAQALDRFRDAQTRQVLEHADPRLEPPHPAAGRPNVRPGVSRGRGTRAR